MGIINRGIKNAFRNTTRTISVTFILGLSIAMALVMLLAMKTVEAKISSVKSSIGNIITVSPAGVRGFEGGGELLTEQNASDIKSLANVTTVTETLSDRLSNNSDTTTSNFPGESISSTNNKTNLSSPVEPGTFGNRQRQQESSSSSTNSTAAFSMPINVTSVNDLSLAGLSVSQFDLKSGEKINPNSTDSIAMIGTDLATKNNLEVGGTFQAYGQDIKVVGIFDSGNTFSNAGIVMPIKTVQNLSGQAGKINTLIVQTNSIDTVSSVQAAIKDKLGSSKVDVTSAQDTSQNSIAPLENIKTISLYSLIGSLIAGAVIILLIMMMIVRERRREIGVLKAIGASNIGIVSQFTVESLVLTFLGSVLGIVLGFAFSNPVLKVLVNNAQSATETVTRGEGPGRGVGPMMAKIGSNAGNILNNIHAVVGWDLILYGILAAVVIAVIGSAIPSFIISKIRPAEVMRAE